MRMPGRISLIFLRAACSRSKSAWLRDIDLGDDRGVGGVEQRGIFERLVFAFSHAEERYANLLAQIVARRADQVADVFDKEVVEARPVPSLPS